MTSLRRARARLEHAVGLPAVMDAAYDAFENLLAVIREHEDPASSLFAAFMFAAASAANGRDAILFAPSLPPSRNANLCRSKIGFWRMRAPSSMSGGSHVLVDQATQDRFSADLASVEALLRDAGRMVFSVGDALVDALMRAGRVVVLLVLGQDGAQVYLTQDEYRIQQLTAQRADEPTSRS